MHPRLRAATHMRSVTRARDPRPNLLPLVDGFELICVFFQNGMRKPAHYRSHWNFDASSFRAGVLNIPFGIVHTLLSADIRGVWCDQVVLDGWMLLRLQCHYRGDVVGLCCCFNFYHVKRKIF